MQVFWHSRIDVVKYPQMGLSLGTAKEVSGEERISVDDTVPTRIQLRYVSMADGHPGICVISVSGRMTYGKISPSMSMLIWDGWSNCGSASSRCGWYRARTLVDRCMTGVVDVIWGFTSKWLQLKTWSNVWYGTNEHVLVPLIW